MDVLTGPAVLARGRVSRLDIRTAAHSLLLGVERALGFEEPEMNCFAILSDLSGA